MATFFSGATVGYWSFSSNYMYGTLTGNVSRSGNTVTLSSMTLSITPRYSSSGTSNWSFTVHNSTFSGRINHPPTSISIPNTSFGVSTTQTSASVGWSSSDGYSGSFSVSFPSGATAPTGLGVNTIRTTENKVTGNVYISGWGQGAAGAGSRYRELQVGTANNTNNQYFQPQSGSSLSGNITVSSSSSKRGTITLSPNTRYYIGLYASNGNANTGSKFPNVSAYTLATGTVALQGKTTPTGATFNVTATSGAQTPTIQLQYKKRSESTWHDGSSYSGTSGTISLSGLRPYMEYDVRVAVSVPTMSSQETVKGTWYSSSIRIRTKANMRVVLPNGDVKYVAIKLIYPNGTRKVVTRFKKIT